MTSVASCFSGMGFATKAGHPSSYVLSQACAVVQAPLVVVRLSSAVAIARDGVACSANSIFNDTSLFICAIGEAP